MARGLAILCFLLCVARTLANSSDPAHITPKVTGERTIVVEFAVDASNKPGSCEIVSSEAPRLDPWAKAMIQLGRIKVGSPGVSQVSEGKHRAVISFPVTGDSAPLPDNFTLPVAKLQNPPTYPFELAKSGIAGSALFKLTFDESAKITKIELIRGSNPLLVAASQKALRQWRFSQPAKKAEVPIAITLYQLFTFAVEGGPLPSWDNLITPEPALPEYSITCSFIPAGDTILR